MTAITEPIRSEIHVEEPYPKLLLTVGILGRAWLWFIAACVLVTLLPLLFGDATGKELERPMAQVILGGLFTSTLLNMIVVPTLFLKFGWEGEEVFQQQLALERGELFQPGIPSSSVPASNPGGSPHHPSVGHR